MAAPKKAVNPFYVILVLVGVCFFITATAYSVMTVRQLQVGHLQDQHDASRQLLRFLDQYGFILLLGELVVLALATVGAIATDRYWIRRG